MGVVFRLVCVQEKLGYSFDRKRKGVRVFVYLARCAEEVEAKKVSSWTELVDAAHEYETEFDRSITVRFCDRKDQRK